MDAQHEGEIIRATDWAQRLMRRLLSKRGYKYPELNHVTLCLDNGQPTLNLPPSIELNETQLQELYTEFLSLLPNA